MNSFHLKNFPDGRAEKQLSKKKKKQKNLVIVQSLIAILFYFM